MGVMEFATRMFDVLMMKHQADLKWSKARTKRNKQLLRLGALLHDTGHTPFSHGSEDLLPGIQHEDVSREFILSDPIASLIEEFKSDLGITSDERRQLFQKGQH